jgi:copper chaperone CopZ
MGKRTLFVYLFTLITGALASGLFIDYFLPREWFILAIESHEHQHGILPYWIQLTSGIITIALLLNIYIRKYYKKIKKGKIQQIQNMGDIKVFVHGMNCNHCKMNVESNLIKLEGIENVEVDLDSEQVTLKGVHIDLTQVKSTVESIGYKFEEIK